MVYENRREAGRLLAFYIKGDLSKTDPANIVVLGLARGGVIIAQEIAKEYGCRMDVTAVKKIGYPNNPELAAAVVTENEIFLNANGTIMSDYVKTQTDLKRNEIKKQLAIYRQFKPKETLKSKIVILTDDGVATGLSMRCTIAQVRREKPEKVYVAVPVGAVDSVKELSQEADRVFCLYSPAFFAAVGQFYEKFPQLTDKEVIDVLKTA